VASPSDQASDQPSDQASEDGADLGGVALAISVLALLVGAAGAFLGWRAHRRTVSS
jgi:hypothetical protein